MFFFLLFAYICIGDPIIKMECWDHITRLDFAFVSTKSMMFNASPFPLWTLNSSLFLVCIDNIYCLYLKEGQIKNLSQNWN